ncbi:Homocysteine S-methyltransferase [Guyanagaster necrorhizus]|uniref:Homocysteine S-methyltransferase n=1 Tax=Guyanagaster necrorhizus TaxID=856835 RepID=A0A9P8AL73_9AGAR|nr:Homocysteine S-methyltransferase [Guyanagaster necrorhizus MCA 3950]KAG7439475.1 Homocysteine S-methyltransferase [Guyanagaster necrorhizus MCA 3950]
MAPLLSKIFPRTPVISDGGLGTTLENDFHVDISNTPLWSSRAVVEQPDVMIQAHLAFLRAGAQLILTSTYQSSFSTFYRSGYKKDEAIAIMRKSVQLANEARKIFIDSARPAGSHDVRIGLSLGAFGASLGIAHEFDGYYPPPYGPRAYTEGDNLNSYSPDETEQEQASVDALALFHFERVEVFLSDRETWGQIDCLAFETIPLVREIRAIRKAMGMVEARITQDGLGLESKPWWIEAVFPDGVYPETLPRAEGTRLGVADVAAAALRDDGLLPAPSGFGINCTAMEHVRALVPQVTNTVKELHLPQKPWLVVYPNGGDVYDAVTQTWMTSDTRSVIEKREEWVQNMECIVKDIEGEVPWGGIIVGGCCRTNHEDVERLCSILKPEITP